MKNRKCNKSAPLSSLKHRNSFRLFHLGTKKKYALFIPKEKKGDNYPSQASKKTDLLGQDTSKLDEQEFKLQSMVSPEFHSNQHFKNNFKQVSFRKFEINIFLK